MKFHLSIGASFANCLKKKPKPPEFKVCQVLYLPLCLSQTGTKQFSCGDKSRLQRVRINKIFQHFQAQVSCPKPSRVKFLVFLDRWRKIFFITLSLFSFTSTKIVCSLDKCYQLSVPFKLTSWKLYPLKAFAIKLNNYINVQPDKSVAEMIEKKSCTPVIPDTDLHKYYITYINNSRHFRAETLHNC